LSKIILAVDFGERRIGLAVSDPSCIIARPYRTLDTLKDKNPFITISDIVKKENIGLVLVGYPYHTNGSISAKAKTVDGFIQKLAAQLPGIPVQHTDERYSSVDAKEIIMQKKRKKRGDKKTIDRFAAALFLQEFLDAHPDLKL
jgi:putative Holliday junction resolvase